MLLVKGDDDDDDDGCDTLLVVDSCSTTNHNMYIHIPSRENNHKPQIN